MPDRVQITRPEPATVVLTGGEVLKEWRETLAEEVPNAKYTRAFQKGHWDGMRRPGKSQYLGARTWRMHFSRGLLPEIRSSFPDAEEEVEFDPPPADLSLPWDHLRDLPPLLDYQVESLAEIFARRWGRIALATNAGKGAIIGLAAVSAADEGIQSLILADEISVFQALHEEVRKWGGVDPGIVASGRDDPPGPHDRVVLAMVPTLYRRLGLETDDKGNPDPDSFHPRWQEWREWLTETGMVLLDEADRATADRWKAICSLLRNTHYRIGFSGSFDTASPLDELSMLELMGPVLTQVKNVELVERGISARPTVELHRYVQELPVPRPKMWFNMTGPERRRWSYERGVVRNDHRHQFIRDLLPEREQSALVVRRIEHGQELETYLEDSFFLHGSHSAKERDRVLRSFENGEFQYLIVTSIVDRGTNRLAPVRNIFYVSGEGSQTQQLQRCGRGLRKWEDKETVRFCDIIDVPPPGIEGANVNPYKYFVNSAEKRIDLYNKEQFEIRIVDHGM